MLFLAELNELELQSTNTGNVCLEEETKEKVYVIGGKEFSPIEDHTLVIKRYSADFGVDASTSRKG